KPEEIREQAFKDARVFHFGSLSLTKKESKEATEKAIEVARKNGLKVTMDPNIRFNLWSSHSVLKKLVRSLLKKVDILKLSKEEVSFLTGSDDLGVGTAELADLGPDPVIVTLGEEGCLFYYKGTLEKLDSYKVEVKDTTGAGDGFMAGFLHTLLKNTENLSALDSRELLPAVRFGNATGALTTTDYGATSAFPNSELVESFLADR
ncbi:carbohydrate kinase, partial [Candidatus Bipolaricaulota bacterium]|nr:carbohydrate kinase [Candidatus Bipolaricaulota bacterium]